MAGIFKAYDIRGIYGTDLTEDLAYRIGRAFVTFVNCRKVVVARDIRPHSEPLFEACARGITEQGADVVEHLRAGLPESGSELLVGGGAVGEDVDDTDTQRVGKCLELAGIGDNLEGNGLECGVGLGISVLHCWLPMWW